MRALTLVMLLAATPALPWGKVGHQLVASGALQDLPTDCAAWFAGREDVLPDHASDPDHWKRQDPAEGPRHYLDCEDYGGPERVPQAMAAAVARLGRERFLATGQVPWVIQAWAAQLRDAFARQDPDGVALAAAILSHYVADVHVPLHTTRNHNGQETGQRGIHARWESGLVERLVAREDWRPEVRRAEPGTLDGPWVWLAESHARVPAVLEADRRARAVMPLTGGPKVPDGAYWETFLRLQGAEVKARISHAAERTAGLILWAWQAAGRPLAPERRNQGTEPLVRPEASSAAPASGPPSSRPAAAAAP